MELLASFSGTGGGASKQSRGGHHSVSCKVGGRWDRNVRVEVVGVNKMWWVKAVVVGGLQKGCA